MALRKRITNVFAIIAISIAVMLGAIFTGLGSSETYAATAGTSESPIALGTGGSYTAEWSIDNSKDNFYFSFKMAKKGFATISLAKTDDNFGVTCTYKLYVYNSKGKKVWDCQTYAQRDEPQTKYKYQVGLDKGNYTLRVEPEFYSYLGSIQSKITLKTSAYKYFESESNDTFATADLLTLNKKYTGVYGENINIKTSDCFKFKVKAGKKYKLKLGNYNEVFQLTTIVKVCDTHKDSIYCGGDLRYKGSCTFTASKTGYYYIHIYNNFGFVSVGDKYTLLVKQIG